MEFPFLFPEKARSLTGDDGAATYRDIQGL